MGLFGKPNKNNICKVLGKGPAFNKCVLNGKLLLKENSGIWGLSSLDLKKKRKKQNKTKKSLHFQSQPLSFLAKPGLLI